ncbi:MAG: aldo/keto reductase [Desulfobacteraceae bacterium]|nr:aldo/keto reductase [Desulfobacteraceae bacterium]
MLYRKMEKTGDELSILGFGCMRLPQKKRKIDEERATQQVRHAIDNGVNYLDTAIPYHLGGSETFLGRALTDGYREKVKLATKLTSLYVKSRDDMDKVINVQLNNLNTKQIDYYLCHGLSGNLWKQLKEMDVCDFLDKAKADGRISHTGFSFHGDKEAFKEIVDDYDWDMCQIQYNYLDENIQAGTEGLEYAAAKGLGVVIMEPLRGGNIAGRVPPSVQAIWDEAEVKRSPAEWALRWVWDHPEVTVVLSGMNVEEHIEENIRIADEATPESLTDKELKIVERVADKYMELTKVGCTGCRYCMPCPAGVDIPSCFEFYNNKYLFNDNSSKIFYLSRLGDSSGSGNTGFASQCENCGQCEDACPQQLPVQELLEDVVKEFEGRAMKIIGWIIMKILGFQRRSILRKSKKV